MMKFNILLENALDEVIKLGGGKKVIHNAKWRKAQKKLKKYKKTSKGKRGAKLSGVKTNRASYISKERIGVNKSRKR